MRVFLDFLGCRLNEAELERWRREFLARGCRVVGRPEEADVCVLNTCAVTAAASRQSRQAARRLHRRNPQARIVFAGCDADMEPDRAAALPGVDLVVGNRDKDRLVDQVIEHFSDAVSMPVAAQEPDSVYVFPGVRTRAFVKVQDGCNNHCTFCIVSTLRGEERSRPIREVVQEIRQLTELGYREAVLTGVHLGGYGRDLGVTLQDLVVAILEETPLERLRLSSLEPWDIPVSFFKLWGRYPGRLMPHLHLPLQSGCDATLRRMGRRYTTEAYAKLVAAAREHIPDVSITTDIIVGFPGETEAEFEATLRFVAQMHFAHIHIFTYSLREGTPAARMPGQIPDKVKKERSRRLHELMRRQKEAWLARFVGTVRPVLWEEPVATVPERGQRVWSGLTDNYLRVYASVPAEIDLHNAITPTRLLAVEESERLRGAPDLEAASWPKASPQRADYVLPLLSRAAQVSS